MKHPKTGLNTSPRREATENYAASATLSGARAGLTRTRFLRIEPNLRLPQSQKASESRQTSRWRTALQSFDFYHSMRDGLSLGLTVKVIEGLRLFKLSLKHILNILRMILFGHKIDKVS